LGSGHGLIKQIGLNHRAANKHNLARRFLLLFKPLCTFFSFHLFFGVLPSCSTVICNTALGMWGSQILFRYIRTLCIAFHIKCHFVSAFCQSPWRSQSISWQEQICRTHVQSMSVCALGLCECHQDVTQLIFVVGIFNTNFKSLAKFIV